jgi:hypothetical protein
VRETREKTFVRSRKREPSLTYNRAVGASVGKRRRKRYDEEGWRVGKHLYVRPITSGSFGSHDLPPKVYDIHARHPTGSSDLARSMYVPA